MLPFEDHPQHERRRFPFVMLSLLALNVLVFAYMLTLGPQQLQQFVFTFGAIPAEITGQTQPLTAAWWPYASVITALFVHGGLLHLLGNMIFLWVFGDNVESSLGHLTFLGLYLAAGIVATFAHVLAFPGSDVPLVGASGAIAGVLGGYLLLFPQAQVRVLLFFGPFFALGRVAALLIIFGWFVLQVFRSVGAVVPGIPENGGVAYLAHVGGFITGLALTAIIRTARQEPLGTLRGASRLSWTFRNWLIAVFLFAGLLAIGALIGGPVGAAVQGFALGLAAFAALIDGLLRASGRHALLGEGRGAGRLIAVIQIVVALAVLGAILAL